MSLDNETAQPTWDTPITVKLNPDGLINSLFSTASDVHTGWSSCIVSDNVLAEVIIGDDTEGNYCRLVEQEFAGSGESPSDWHDWTVELKFGEVYITGHWQITVDTPPFEWEWCEQQAAEAFSKGGVLFGKRVRRGGLVIEETFSAETNAKATHH